MRKTKVTQSHVDLLKKLDSLMDKYFNNINVLPILQTTQIKTTFIDPSVDVTYLEPGFNIYSVTNEKNKNEQKTITRGYISLNLAIKCAFDESVFIHTMSIAINDMLKDLMQNVGDIQNRNLTLKRPGQGDPTYFTILENVAAVEFRLRSEVKE